MSDKQRKYLLFLWSSLLFLFIPFMILHVQLSILFSGIGLLFLVLFVQSQIHKHLEHPVVESHYIAFLYQFMGLFVLFTFVIMISHLLDIYFLGLNPLLLIWFGWFILAIPFSIWGIYRAFYRLSF